MNYIPGLVVGVDFSLNSTGYCFVRDDWLWVGTFVPKSREPIVRLKEYLDFFYQPFGGRGTEVALSMAQFIIVENYSYTKSTNSTTGLAEQRGLFYAFLLQQEITDRFILVSPMTLKKFGCGEAKIAKDMFVARVCRKYNRDFKTSDECDAFVLAQMMRTAMNKDLLSKAHAYEIESLKKVLRFKELVDANLKAIRNGVS